MKHKSSLFPVSSDHAQPATKHLRGYRANSILLAACGLVLACCSPAQAQTAHYSGVANTVGSGFSSPRGAAVGASGDVFVADTTNNTVKEIVAVNGVVSSSSTVLTEGSGFSSPNGVAVDRSGNVYVADTGNNAVKEFYPSVSGSLKVSTIGSGFSGPKGVAVDSSGDVFVADSGNSAVKEIVAVSGVVSASSTVLTAGSGFSAPAGVAVDLVGDVFVADTGNSAVKEIVAFNGAVSASSSIQPLVGSFDQPRGVVLDGSGDVFIGDSSDNAVKEIELAVADFGTLGVGNASGTILIPFTFDSAGTPSGWAVYTQGATGLDFTEVPVSSTCSTTTSYLAGETCSVAVRFAPRAAGLRMGAVQLLDSGGNVIATARLTGIGSAPQVVFPGNIASPLVGSGFQWPLALAVDAGGDVFVADFRAGAIKEIVAVNGAVSSTSNVLTLTTGSYGAFSVAVDGSGNIFFTNGTIDGAVLEEIVAVNGTVSSSSPVVPVGGGAGYPAGAVAVDARGDVFFTGDGVQEIVAVNGAVSNSSTVLTLLTRFNPTGLAIDASGDVFVTGYSDTYQSELEEIVAVNGEVSPTSKVVTVASGFYNLNAAAVDASGDVFVADEGYASILGQVYEIVAVNGAVSSSSTVRSVGSGFSYPSGVALSGNGNVLVAGFDINADYSNALPAVNEIQFAKPPSLIFGTVASTTSSPQAVTIANEGNAPLIFPLPKSGTNPIVSGNFLWDSSSTCLQTDSSSTAAFTLAPGAMCTIAIDFAPPGLGNFPGSVLLTDTSGWNPTRPVYADQKIDIAGTGLLAQAINFPNPGTQSYGATIQLTATGGSSGNPVTFTLVSGPAYLYGNSLMFYGTGTVTVAANQLGNKAYAAAPTIQQTFTVTNALLTVEPLPPVQPGMPSFSVSYGANAPNWIDRYVITGFVNGDNIGVVSGAATVTPDWGTDPNVGTYPLVLGVGTLSAPKYNFTAVNGTVAVIPSVLTLKPQGKSIQYGEAIPALEFTAVGLVYGQTASVLSGTAVLTTTATPQSGVGSYPVSINVTGVTAANYTVVLGADSELTIRPATLVARAINSSVKFGQPIPPLTYRITGFVNGDTNSVVSGAATLATTPTQGSQPGTYPITFSSEGLSAANYNIVYLGATLTIEQ